MEIKEAIKILRDWNTELKGGYVETKYPSRIPEALDAIIADYDQNQTAQEFVKNWMEEQEPDTFIKNEHGAVIYSAGNSSLNLVVFFESLLEDFMKQEDKP